MRFSEYRAFRLAPVVLILALLLIALLVSVGKVSAQVDCQGPDCSVTDTCEGQACLTDQEDERSEHGTGDSAGDADIGTVGIGCTVTEIPEEGHGATCSYYCHDDRLGFIFLEDEGLWVLDEPTSHITGENEFVPYNGVPICTWDFAAEPPCTSITISSSGEITCGGDFSVSASARVPCMTILRDPYPRGLVSAPNVFWLNGPWSAIGSESSRAWCTPKIRNYTLEVGWQFFPAVPPRWLFDDRAWSDGPQYGEGMVIAHTYETSSWGLPANGPSLEGRLELPAYQVRVGTAWQAIVRRTWEELERGDRRSFNCGAGDDSCWDLYAICESPGTDPQNDDCYHWHWVFHDTGWVPVDLTQYGYPEPYYVSWAAGDTTMPPPGVLAVPLNQRLCNAPVPVIESQALLNSPGNEP